MARYYAMALSRWAEMDPADQFHSPYTYVGNDPVNRIDPDGRQSPSISARIDARNEKHLGQTSGFGKQKLDPGTRRVISGTSQVIGGGGLFLGGVGCAVTVVCGTAVLTGLGVAGAGAGLVSIGGGITDLALGASGVPESDAPTASGVFDAVGREYGFERTGEWLDIASGFAVPTSAFTKLPGITQTAAQSISRWSNIVPTMDQVLNSMPPSSNTPQPPQDGQNNQEQ